MRLRFFPATAGSLLILSSVAILSIEAFTTTSVQQLPSQQHPLVLSAATTPGSSATSNDDVEEDGRFVVPLVPGETKVGDTIFAGEVTERAKRLNHRAILKEYRIRTVHGDDVCLNDRLMHPTGIVVFLRSLG
jgi:hypothetical protein